MKILTVLLILLLPTISSMANEKTSLAYISSSADINERLAEILGSADIPYKREVDGGILFEPKYQKIMDALSFELVRDKFRPYKEVLLSEDGKPASIRPYSNVGSSLFVSGYQTKFGNFATEITLKFANEKKLKVEDSEKITELLEEIPDLYKTQHPSKE